MQQICNSKQTAASRLQLCDSQSSVASSHHHTNTVLSVALLRSMLQIKQAVDMCKTTPRVVGSRFIFSYVHW